MDPLHILLVENSINDAELLMHRLRRMDNETITRRVDTPITLVAALDERAWDMVISDYRMTLPVVIASGFIDETLSDQADSAGVRDLIFKASAVEDLTNACVRLALAAKSRPA